MSLKCNLELFLRFTMLWIHNLVFFLVTQLSGPKARESPHTYRKAFYTCRKKVQINGKGTRTSGNRWRTHGSNPGHLARTVASSLHNFVLDSEKSIPIRHYQYYKRVYHISIQ